MLSINTKVANEHLAFIDPKANEFAFAAYTEKGRDGSRIADRMFGPLDKFLDRMAGYQERYGAVYFSVNEIDPTKGTARKEDVSRVRSLFIDLDDPSVSLDDLYAFPLKVHRVVETSPGKYQAYWRVDGLSVVEAEGYTRWLVSRFSADKGVWDAARVFRLPGTWHRKGEDFQVRVVHRAKNTKPYTLEAIDKAGVKWVAPGKTHTVAAYVPPTGVDVDMLVQLVNGGDMDCLATWNAERAGFNAISGLDGSRYHMAIAAMIKKCRLPIEVFDVYLRAWVAKHSGGDRQNKINRPGYIAMTWAKCGVGSQCRQNEGWEAWRARRDAVLGLFEDGQILDNGESDLADVEEFLWGCSDDALAMRAANKFRGNIRHTPQFGKWHIWDGLKWSEDTTKESREAIRLFLRDEAALADEKATALTLERAGALPDRAKDCKRLAGKLRTLATRLRKNSTCSDVVSFFLMERRDGTRVVTHIDEWDRRDDLLATADGIIDLNNGDMVPEGRDYFCSMATLVGPAAKGTKPKRWLKFLNEVFNDKEVIDFMHTYLGYALTGYVREECFVFAYGNGRNGKGVLTNTVCDILGSYGKTADADLFTLAGVGQHKSGLASLQGKRFILSSEIPDGASWNIQRIKNLTGGDTIEANFMRQNKFEFRPKFSLIICANDKPALRHVDNSVKARFRFVEFPNSFVDGEDRTLREDLRAEYPAILRWLIEGAEKYIKRGLPYPDVIRAATEKYLDEANTLACWFRDVEIRGEVDKPEVEELWHTTSDLMISYGNFCKASASRPVGKHAFLEYLRSKGYEMRRKNFKYRYNGVPWVWGPFRDMSSRR